MPNSLWLQLLKCNDFMLFFVIYDSKLNVFGFGTIGRINQDVWVNLFGCEECCGQNNSSSSETGKYLLIAAVLNAGHK